MENIIISALSNPVRLKLLCCLSKGKKNVQDLIKNCGLAQSAVSQHLIKLKQAGLVKDEKDGKFVYYSLNNPKAARIAKDNFILLDVRTKEEYAKSKIKNSINLPLDQVESKITQVIPDKNATIYTYCLSGSRSTNAVQIMLKLGYKNVFSMTSGLLAWRAKGFKLE